MASNALTSNPSALESSPFSAEIQHAVERELEAICNDSQFRTSQRNCAFLRYVIRETLAGRADEIKERTLGKELFGRPISYDTGSDAVVRVRANELRKRLICYYETHRSQAGWRLHLPLRTYVPEFVPDEESQLHREAETAPERITTAAPATVREIAQATSYPVVELPSYSAMRPIAGQGSAQAPEVSASWLESSEFVLPVSRMMIPTLIALFLCVATFRWQAAYGTPYLDFWEALLSSRPGIAVVLDTDPADPRAVMTNDVQMIAPLLRTASDFHRSTEIASSAHAESGTKNLLTVHVTHRSPMQADGRAAYVTVVPGDKPQLWVGSSDAHALDLAIHSLSDTNLFPAALQLAARRNTPTRIRLSENEQVTAQTLPFPHQPGEMQW
jgi:hypothetical protein